VHLVSLIVHWQTSYYAAFPLIYIFRLIYKDSKSTL
jgi:hypothetical protein